SALSGSLYKRCQSATIGLRNNRSNLCSLRERIAPDHPGSRLFKELHKLRVATGIYNGAAICSAPLAGKSEGRFGDLLGSIIEVTIIPHYRGIVSSQLGLQGNMPFRTNILGRITSRQGARDRHGIDASMVHDLQCRGAVA